MKVHIIKCKKYMLDACANYPDPNMNVYIDDVLIQKGNHYEESDIIMFVEWDDDTSSYNFSNYSFMIIEDCRTLEDYSGAIIKGYTVITLRYPDLEYVDNWFINRHRFIQALKERPEIQSIMSGYESLSIKEEIYPKDYIIAIISHIEYISLLGMNETYEVEHGLWYTVILNPTKDNDNDDDKEIGKVLKYSIHGKKHGTIFIKNDKSHHNYEDKCKKPERIRCTLDKVLLGSSIHSLENRAMIARVAFFMDPLKYLDEKKVNAIINNIINFPGIPKDISRKVIVHNPDIIDIHAELAKHNLEFNQEELEILSEANNPLFKYKTKEEFWEFVAKLHYSLFGYIFPINYNEKNNKEEI